MFDDDPDLSNSVRNLGGPTPSRNLAAQNIKFRRDFPQLRDLITIISETQQDNRKKALQTANTPAQAHLTCTLVHKRLKIGPKF